MNLPPSILASGEEPPESTGRRLRIIYAVGAAATVLLVAVITGAIPGWRLAARPLPSGRIEQLMSTGAAETSPTLSPDGEWIAYRSDDAGNGDIYIRRVGENRATNLTTWSEGDESDPAFSPDGEWIAFRSVRTGGGIFVMRRDGGSLRRLTQFGVTPTWMPDGKTIVFATRSSVAASSARSGVSEGWLVDVESRAVRTITRTDFRHPSVSPRGRRIAYWGFSESFTAPRGSRMRADLWTVRPDGTGRVRLTNDDAMDWSPVWSSDGQYLYFVSTRNSTQGIWRVRVDERSGRLEGEPEAVTSVYGVAGSLTRSVDEQRFAWSSFSPTRAIYRIAFSPDARAVKGEAVIVGRSTLPFVSAEPSPDGAMMVLASGPPSEDVFVARADGSDRRRLTDGTGRESSPRWSPDGTRIAFVSDRHRADTIWIVNVDGSGLRQLAGTPGELVHPVWSPDGSKIAAWDKLVKRVRIFPVLDHPAPAALQTLSDFALEEFVPASWSPDGVWLAGTAGSYVWIYSPDQRAVRRIAPGSSPVWLNDSTRLLYVNDGRIHIAEIVWTFTREVMTLPGEDLQAPALTNDNRFLYFSRPRTDADLWLLTVTGGADHED